MAQNRKPINSVLIDLRSFVRLDFHRMRDAANLLVTHSCSPIGLSLVRGSGGFFGRRFVLLVRYSLEKDSRPFVYQRYYTCQSHKAPVCCCADLKPLICDTNIGHVHSRDPHATFTFSWSAVHFGGYRRRLAELDGPQAERDFSRNRLVVFVARRRLEASVDEGTWHWLQFCQRG